MDARRTNDIDIPDDWQALVDRLTSESGWRSAFVIGLTGVGKSTLCRLLGQALSGRGRTALIDCDPGQSTIGPPTTVGLGTVPIREHRPEALHFVGATSPPGHYLQLLSGIRRLDDLAAALDYAHVLFDSSGFVEYDAGREFHFQTVDLLAPDHLVIVGDFALLERFALPFARRDRPVVHRVEAAAASVSRSREARTSYRRKRYLEYFADACVQEIPASVIGFHGRIPDLSDSRATRNLLCGLCNRDGFTEVVGILETASADRLLFFAPPFERSRIASIHFGSTRLDREGNELA